MMSETWRWSKMKTFQKILSEVINLTEYSAEEIFILVLT